MVEIIYNDANTGMMKTENLIRLPKNIRQIGIVGEKLKIYTEDYVKSYLNQHFERSSQTGFILFGKTVTARDKKYIFIDGAISVDTKDIFHRDSEIYTEAWKRLETAAGEYFADLELVGWACEGDIEAAEDVHRRFFQESSKIFIQLSEMETEYYLAEQGNMQRQEGYYIYYARNEAMQTYMVEQQDAGQLSHEEIQDERTIEQFRQIMKERKEIVKHGRMMTVLSCASSFLALLVLAIGITMINHYEKMQAMEVALVALSTTLEEDNMTAQTVEEQQSDDYATATVEAAVSQPEETVQIEASQENTAEDISQEEAYQEEHVQKDINIEERADREVQEDIIQEVVNVDTADNYAAEHTYIVKKGDTLAHISVEYYQTRDMVDEICELNHIYNKDVILCGQKILLP